MPPEAPGPVRIRSAAIADVPQLTAVVNAAFAVETFLDGRRTDVQGMEAALRGAEFLVAEAGAGHIVACVRLEHRDRLGRFGMLAVDPAWQGEGLGQAMVEAAEERFRALGCTHVSITVLSLRPELLPFYRKLGYAETGTEPFRTQRRLADGVACHGIVLGRKL